MPRCLQSYDDKRLLRCYYYFVADFDTLYAIDAAADTLTPPHTRYAMRATRYMRVAVVIFVFADVSLRHY